MTLDIGPVEWLGEDISSHLPCGTEVDFYLLLPDFLTDPVHLDIDVLHTTMVFRVPEDLEGGLVVDHEVCGSFDFHTNLDEKGMEPENLASRRGCRNIFSLSRRICNYSLFLG